MGCTGQPHLLCPPGRGGRRDPSAEAGSHWCFPPPQESCASLRHYLTSTLGPYVANVMAAARACSYRQCHGHGRCVRRQPHDLGSLLHLGPSASPPASFRCHCYRGWTGEGCAQQVQTGPTASCLAPTHAHGLYGQNDLPPSDTCLPRGTWGW